MGRLDEHGVWTYDNDDVRTAQSWQNLLNLGQDSISGTLLNDVRASRGGRILTAYSLSEQTQLLAAYRAKYNIAPSDSSPVLVYRYDLDMLMACGSTWKRISGHAMWHHKLLTRDRNYKTFSATKLNLGYLSFVLHAETEVVLGLSANIYPTGWSSGYFYCKPSWISSQRSPNGIEPYGYWSSQETSSRFSYYREWASTAPRGWHHVTFAYEATKDSPETVIGTVWGTVRYSTA